MRLRKWYHGTTTFIAETILAEGFRFSTSPGIWGQAIYLADTPEESKTYGETLLVVEGDDSKVLVLDYQRDIPVLYPGLSHEEEEASTELRTYCLEHGYLAASITYKDGCTHLVVYDLSYFNVIDLENDFSERFA